MKNGSNINIIENRLTTEIQLTRLRIETGKYLEHFRKIKKLSRKALSEKLGVSSNYVNEIERGYKMPSDSLIRKLAIEYGIEEEDIFIRYGKIPLLAREEFEKSVILQKMLVKIAKDKDLSEVQKEILYDKLYKQCLLIISESQEL